MQIGERALSWLGRVTTTRRDRAAASVFLIGSASTGDRLAASLYFAVAARRWGRHSESAHHLAAFDAGLEHCQPPTSALDIGTGAGASAAAVATRWPSATVVGVDWSRSMLQEAAERHRLPNLSFRRADVVDLPFPDATFDLVTTLNAVAEPREVARVSRPGAQLMLGATFVGPRADDSVWVARWREAGFHRLETGEASVGSWELYERAVTRPTRPAP